MRPPHGILLAVTLLLTAPALARAGEGGEGKTYKTPQAVFDAAKQAVAKENWKEFCGCLTKDSQTFLTGLLVLIGSQIEDAAMKGMGDKDEQTKALIKNVIKELLKPVMKVYAKYGVTEDHLNKVKGKINFLKGAPQDPLAIMKGLNEAAKPVKNQTAFISDFMAAFQTIQKMFGKGEKQGPVFDFFPHEGRLEDVKVEGDTAKGFVVRMKRGQEKREPMQFRKEGGSWKIDLPLEPGGPKGGPKVEPKKEKEPGVRGNAPASFSWKVEPAGEMVTACQSQDRRCATVGPRKRFLT
jgi:hypothetical protein